MPPCTPVLATAQCTAGRLLTDNRCSGRGVNGLHVVLLLFAYKLLYPQKYALIAPRRTWPHDILSRWMSSCIL